jgi:hypothetical protein
MGIRRMREVHILSVLMMSEGGCEIMVAMREV